MRGGENGAGHRAAPAPRANPDLFGHEGAEAALRQLVEVGRLPHALLLSGPRGIGKATLAFRLARFVLARSGEGAPGDLAEGLAISPLSGLFRRIAAGGHADLLTVERAYDPRRRRLRGEIVVDDARAIGAFMRLTAAEGGWRIVIADGADEMNRNAANAMLKVLEEPPRRALLLLVAHSPGRLLPTIRSRCRHFPLAPLMPDIVLRLLERFRPELDRSEADVVVRLAGGSIGRALDLADAGGVALYRTLLALLSRPQGIDAAALHGFADRLVRPEAEDAYRVVEELLAQLLARLAHAAAGRPAPAAEDAAVIEALGRRASAADWAGLRATIADSFARADALNLDRKQTLIGAFFAIDRPAR